MGQKAQVPIPDDWDGDDTLCVCVAWPNSVKWLGILQGLLSAPTRGRFWDGATGNILDVQEVAWQIWGANMPLKDCGGGALIEVGIGALVGDLSVTRINSYPASPALPTDINSASPTQRWIGDTGASSAEVEKRRAILCLATQRFVAAICRGELIKRQAGVVGAEALLAVIGVGLAFAAAPAAALAGLALAALGAGIGAFDLLSEAVLEDTDAQEAVACCLFSSIQEQGVSEESLLYGLDRCCFTAGSAEAQLAGAVAPAIAYSYDAFVDFIAEAYTDALDYDCPCTADTWYWQIQRNISGAESTAVRVAPHTLRIDTGAISRPFGSNKRVIVDSYSPTLGLRPAGADILSISDGGPSPYVVYAYSNVSGYRQKGVHPFPWQDCYQIAIDGPDGDSSPSCWAEFEFDPSTDCVLVPP